MTLSVRSLKSGQVLHFAPSEDLPDAASLTDAAMSFGEGMGFLFDDDELAVGDAERAHGIWVDLMGDPPTQPPVEALAEPQPAVEEASFEFVEEEDEPDELELLLVEAIDEATVDEPVAAGQSAPALEPTPDPAPEVSAEPAPEVSPPPDTNALTSLVEDALAADGTPALSEAEGVQPAAPMLTKFRSASSEAVTEPQRPEIVSPEFSDSESDPEDGVGPELESDESAIGGDASDAEANLPDADGLVGESPVSVEPTQAANASEADEPSTGCASTEDDTPVLHEADSDRPLAPAVAKGGRLRKAALGRLRLVKKRKPASDEDRRKWLARILSTF
ncbi:MAG: hypothetical protein GY937_19035 [bacterium]|nr:hypothetical protein [bacterium]